MDFAPELGVYITANLSKANMIVADVIQRISSVTFGEDTELAQRYLCCHYLTLAKNSSGGGVVSGAITSETVGDISVSYANNSNLNGSIFDSTQYGLMFNQLRKENILGLVVGSE